MLRPCRCLALGLLCALTFGPPPALAQTTVVSPIRALNATGFADEDDMCFWLHPTDLSLSTAIVSDKSADKLFVYDLQGALVQTITSSKPGNIDVRYNFVLGGQSVDIVAFNERNTNTIRVYTVDRVTRMLTRVDNNLIATGANYGFTLYRSPFTGKVYGFTGPETNTMVKQWELVDDGTGHVAGVGPLRTVGPGSVVEGMVADDETGMLYLSEEAGGEWKYSAEPTGGTAGVKIAVVGQDGLVADVEGVTICYGPALTGYIILSSQGNSTFKVYDRKPPHTFRGTFTVTGTSSTDGCDVINLPLNATFPTGAFVCHNGSSSPYPDELVRWGDIAAGLGLNIDTGYWDPRRVGLTGVEPRPQVTAANVLLASPNPMQRLSTLNFSLAHDQVVRLSILDIEGRQVRRLQDGTLPAGLHALTWDARDERAALVRPGIYMARLELETGPAVSRKLVVVDR
jgi:3-phytase